MLASLPGGFALAVMFGGSRWPDRPRALVGGLLCVAALIPLCLLPLTNPVPAISLAALEIELGLFTSANNGTALAAIPAASSGGGLVNMTRWLGHHAR